MSPFRFCLWISEGLPVQVFGDGTQSRDFTFVDDIARGTILGLRPLGFEVINLGYDRPFRTAAADRADGGRDRQPRRTRVQRDHAADVPSTWASI